MQVAMRLLFVVRFFSLLIVDLKDEGMMEVIVTSSEVILQVNSLSKFAGILWFKHVYIVDSLREMLWIIERLFVFM